MVKFLFGDSFFVMVGYKPTNRAALFPINVPTDPDVRQHLGEVTGERRIIKV